MHIFEYTQGQRKVYDVKQKLNYSKIDHTRQIVLVTLFLNESAPKAQQHLPFFTLVVTHALRD